MKKDKREDKRIYCDVCKTQLSDDDGSNVVIGIAINSSYLKEDKLKRYDVGKIINDMFGKSNFNICFPCMIKAFGVKPLNEIKDEKRIKKYHFNKIFYENPDGSITTKVPICIYGKTIAPKITFKKNEKFRGINFNELIENTFLCEIINGIVVITGICK